jgi:integrase/recombinase XerD
MIQVTLKPLHHRGQESIAIYYENYATINNIIKKLPGVKWSQTNKCWYVALNPESYNHLYKALNGKAELNITSLKQYLEKRKKVVATAIPTKQNIVKPVPFTSPVWKLSGENLEALETFVQLLKLKAYSESTIRTYRSEFIQLLQLLKSKAVNELTPDDLKRYMVYAMEKQGINENTAHSRINALKFYFEQVLHRDKFFWEIPRPKKPEGFRGR